MNSKILINICIPFYNNTEYFEELIQSIKQQNYKYWKLWIYNDGSHVSNVNILKSILKKNKVDAIIFTGKHDGVYNARINLIKNIKYGYIVFADADDLFIGKKCFNFIVNSINKSNADIVYYDYSIKSNMKTGVIEKSINFESVDNVICESLKNNILNSLCIKAVNSNIVKNINFVNKKNLFIAEDRFLSLQILKNCKSVYYCNEVLYWYRNNLNSVTNKKIGLDRIEVQIKVEKEITKIYKDKYNNVYSLDNYIWEHVIYPHLWYNFKNRKKRNARIESYKKVYEYIFTSVKISKWTHILKYHREICLNLFVRKNFLVLDFVFSCIKKIKGAS